LSPTTLPSIREGIRVLLDRWRPGWNLAGEAADGEEVVRMAAFLKPDVIVLDVSMPGTSGVEAALRIAELGIESRIVLLAAQDSSVISRLAAQVHAYGYVDKRNIVRDLIPAIERALCHPAVAP
jgi:response regulator NasT